MRMRVSNFEKLFIEHEPVTIAIYDRDHKRSDK